MNSFNLFSVSTKKKAIATTLIKLPTAWAAIFGFLFFVILISIIVSFVNLYYSTQVTDRGNYIISLIATQNKYKDTIDSINNYNARKNSLGTIVAKRISTVDIINDIDNSTNKTAKSYNIDTNTLGVTISGEANDISDPIGYALSLKNNPKYTAVILQEISKSNKIYLYNISLTINSEKVQAQ